MAKWTKKTMKLRDDHGWSAPAGYRIFVGDRGAIRFNFPQGWIVLPEADAIRFYDMPPPSDNCALGVSVMRLPPIDWSGLPLAGLIPGAVQGSPRNLVQQGDIRTETRADLELAWAEWTFDDPNEKRPAFSRLCLARAGTVQALITLDFWPEDAVRLAPVWAEVLRSLELDAFIPDPTRGSVARGNLGKRKLGRG